MQRSCPRSTLKHFNDALKSVCVLLFNTALRRSESFKVRNRFSDACRGNRVEYTCSPPRTDRPHPHSNQTLLHTARNSLLNFNSLSSSATEMPWLVWHRQPIRPNTIGNVFDVEKTFEKITRVVQTNDAPMKSDRKTIGASQTV